MKADRGEGLRIALFARFSRLIGVVQCLVLQLGWILDLEAPIVAVESAG